MLMKPLFSFLFFMVSKSTVNPKMNKPPILHKILPIKLMMKQLNPKLIIVILVIMIIQLTVIHLKKMIQIKISKW